jgi:hypothetical protein
MVRRRSKKERKSRAFKEREEVRSKKERKSREEVAGVQRKRGW